MSGPQLPSQHLTDEQFSDLLAGGSLDSGSEAHLAVCSECQAEAEAVAGSLTEFNTFSMAWAEREAPRRIQTPSRWMLRLGAHPVWNAGLLAAAASVALAIGLHLPQHSAPAAPTTAALQQPVVRPTPTDLAADNRLLASIDQELSYSPQPSVPLAELKAPSHRTPANLEEAVAN